jgi:hypothetical protein
VNAAFIVTAGEGCFSVDAKRSLMHMADQDNNGGVDDATTGTDATTGAEQDPSTTTGAEVGADDDAADADPDAADADADADAADADVDEADHGTTQEPSGD